MNKRIIVIAIALVAVVVGAIYFENKSVEIAVNEPVEIKTNCLLEENIMTEECIRKITDKFAEDLSAMEAQRKVVDKEQEKLDELTEAYNQSVFNIEMIAN